MIIYVSDRPVWRNIRYLCRQRKLSRIRLASMTGIPWITLLLIESRILRDIDYDQLVSLCRVFGVTLEDLIERELHHL